MTVARVIAWAGVVILCLAGCAADPEPQGAARGAPASTPVGAPEGGTATIEAGPESVIKRGGALAGMETAKVEATLGPPSFRRSDGPSEWLQYRSATCILDVFLYRDADAETARVAHVEARTSQLDSVPESTCLDSLMQRRPTTRRR